MDIRIGIVQSMRELDIELSDDTDRDELVAQIEAVLLSDGVLWLTDRKGRRVGVPASRMALVEVGVATGRSVGFGAT